MTIGGLVAGGINRRYTKNNELILFIQVEDLDSSVEVVMFPRVVEEFGQLITPDAILLIDGSVDQRGDDVKVRAEAVHELKIRTDSTVRLRIAARAISARLVSQLKTILQSRPGPRQ